MILATTDKRQMANADISNQVFIFSGVGSEESGVGWCQYWVDKAARTEIWNMN